MAANTSLATKVSKSEVAFSSFVAERAINRVKAIKADAHNASLSSLVACQVNCKCYERVPSMEEISTTSQVCNIQISE